MQTQDFNVGTTEAPRPGSVMQRSQTSSRRPATRVGPAATPPSSLAGPRLNPAMPCDIAFRIVAHRHLASLTENHAATCNGDEDALHRMRVALTQLRSWILFFSPMVEDPERADIKNELKWLN